MSKIQRPSRWSRTVLAFSLLAVLAQGQLSLSLTEPSGPGSIQVLHNGPPNTTVFMAVSFDTANATSPGGGSWFGLHIGTQDLIAQILAGVAPFTQTLDSQGVAVWSLPTGSVPPSLMPLWAVSVTPGSASNIASYPPPPSMGFVPHLLSFSSTGRHAAVGDIDLDGIPDVAVSGGIFLGDGNLGFARVGTSPEGPEALLVDITGDAHPELLNLDALGSFMGLRIYSGNGSGNFSSLTPLTLSAVTEDGGDIRVVDLDNDGDKDILCSTGATNSTGLIEFLQLAPGAFIQVGNHSLAASLACEAGDFNGDGKTDLVVHEATTGFNSQHLYYYPGNGVLPGGAHSARVEITSALPEASTRWLRAGHFNGDGNLDLLFVGTSQVGVLLGDGAGGFSYQSWGTIAACCGGEPTMASLGDLDNDGDLDLVYASGGTDIIVAYNDGNGALQSSDVLNLSVGDAGHVQVADFDGDGDKDILVGGSPATLFENN